MTATVSRHDHFPRADTARRVAIRRTVADLAAGWAAADAAPDGLFAALDALADTPPDIAVERLLPWITDPHWLRGRLDTAQTLLNADPFARPPLRLVGGGDGGSGGLVFADRGDVRLTLQVRPFAPHMPAPATTLFVPGRAAIHVLASGGAQLREHSVAVGTLEEAGGFTRAPPLPVRAPRRDRCEPARRCASTPRGTASPSRPGTATSCCWSSPSSRHRRSRSAPMISQAAI